MPSNRKGPYIPGVSPTGATGAPMPPGGLLAPGAFVPQPALPGGWGGAGPLPAGSSFNPSQWDDSPLLSQYAAQVAPLAGLYGTQQSNALMTQLNVPMPTYGNINWGSPISAGGSGGQPFAPPIDRTPGSGLTPGVLPTTGAGGGLVSGVDVVWGGRPPGAIWPGGLPGSGAPTGGTGGSFWSGVGDWLMDRAGGIGTMLGTIFGGPLGGIIGGGLGDMVGGGNDMGTMPPAPGGVPVNPQPVDGGEIGYMPPALGGVAVNPQPINPLTEQDTSAYAQWLLTAPAGSTVHDFYAAQGGFGGGGLALGGNYGGSGQQELDAAHYWARMNPGYFGRND